MNQAKRQGQAQNERVEQARARAAESNRANFPVVAAFIDELRTTWLGDHVTVLHVCEGGRTIGEDINLDDFVTHTKAPADGELKAPKGITGKQGKARNRALPSWKRLKT